MLVMTGCSPPGFPTEDYINRHIDAYTSKLFSAGNFTNDDLAYSDANLTRWPYAKPKNSLVSANAFILTV